MRRSAAQLMMRSVDAMWRAAGDRSSDFSYYTKRATLAGVYGATFAYWLSDSSEGHAATWTFLDNRIDNVMQFEKFKGAAKDAIAKLPDPLKFLSSAAAVRAELISLAARGCAAIGLSRCAARHLRQAMSAIAPSRETSPAAKQPRDVAHFAPRPHDAFAIDVQAPPPRPRARANPRPRRR